MLRPSSLVLTSSIVLVTLALTTGCGGAPVTAPAAKPAETPAPAAKAPATPPVGHSGPGALGTASIRGTVHFEGDVPTLKPIKMDGDPGCAKKHATQPKSEALVLGQGNTIGNVFLQVKGGLPAATYAPPAEAAVLDQVGCRYVPHVLGVMKGQPVKILNSDGLLHNVHALAKVNKIFNTAMPASRTEIEVEFTEEEFMFKIKCDVHPWMNTFVSVMSHPFFDVTDESGSFEIGKLPAGSYEIEAWHEKLGTQVLTAEVADGQTVELDFTFSR